MDGCAFACRACNLSSSLPANKENILTETEKGPNVADIFRRAQAIRGENASSSYKELAKTLVREYSGSPFPPANRWPMKPLREVPTMMGRSGKAAAS